MDFAIERLHDVDKTFFVFDMPNKSYSCGRSKENMIICLSLLVSRNHCIFIRNNDDLYIKDLESTNGVYINHKIQKSLEEVRLHKNDIIGLGCADINPSNNTLYTYKVCIIESSSLDKKDINALPSTISNSNILPTSTSPTERILGKKCGFVSDCEDIEVPNKKLKNVDKNTHSSKVTLSEEENNAEKNNVSFSNQVLVDSNTNNLANDIIMMDIKTENDIEVIYTSLAQNVENQDINNQNNKFLKCLNSNKLNFNEEIDIIDENNLDESDARSRNKIDVKEKSNSINKIINALNPSSENPSKNSESVHSKEQIIIIKDEQKDERENNEEGFVNMTCDTSLIKLKKIKYELKTRFSEIDVVDLSDDEEEVFPCSQLFDKYEDNTENGNEIKQEYISNDDQNIEKIDLDVDDEVIFLTDSEDEDNPWLERLSKSQLESQLLNDDDKKLDFNNTIVKNEIYLGICNEDDNLNINTNIDDKFEKLNNNNDSNSNNNLLTIEMKAMDINNGDLLPSSKNIDDTNNDAYNEFSLKNITDANKQKTDTELHTELDQQTLKSTKQKSVAKKSASKRISVIEPLHLSVKGSRRTNSSKDRAQKVTEKLPSKLRKEKKMIKSKEKINDNFYVKSHSSNETKTISENEKKMIIEKRKVKLKEIAEEEKKLSAQNDKKNIQRRTAKAIAKVSLKNRGDFLINEQEPSVSKSLSDKSINLSKSNNKNKYQERLTDNIDVMLKKSSTSDIRTQDLCQNDVSKNTINAIAMTFKQSLQLDNISAIQIPKDKQDSKVMKVDNRKKEDSINKKMKKNKKNVKIHDESEHNLAVMQKENFSLNNVKSNFELKKKKKVTFLEKLEVREYEIEGCNSLKKLVGKDAPIPMNKLTKRTPATNVEWSPKLEELFLLRIFSWNPIWLEEQQHLKSEPPIVSQCELQPMRLSYDSYKQYYEIIMPLLLHEIWYTMVNEFEIIEKRKQRATMICSVVENPTFTPIDQLLPSTSLFMTTLKLEVLVKKQDFNKVHPIYGDLVYFEYVTNEHRKQTVNRIFAYVTNMYQTIITDETHYNQNLKKYIENPYAVITYTLLTRSLQCVIPVNRMQRVRTVMYLRAHIRMVQALQYFPQSSLLNLILNPKIEEYQLPPMDEKFTSSSLITKDNLNPKQMEAVYRITETVIKKDAKLCFIQGPPGTGKSKVIVNMISQILYGKRTNRKLRILVCAPSNAAIDEIVLRLLNFRSKLEKNMRFNMVRIGRSECMHPMTKPISVTELAKRHLSKMMQETSCSNNSEDIALLQGQINSLQALLANSQKMDEEMKKELRKKLKEKSTKYDLLKCDKPINELNAKHRAKYQRIAENIIIKGADIIACTLSSCYTNQMESIFGGCKERISVCIVDEATQSCEAETLIPLMLGVRTLVLVGDPNQLSATILSQQAKKLGLDQSIFSRIQKAFASQQNNPIIMLNMQYRMDYAISYWPNNYFYDGKLKNYIGFRTNFPFYSYRVLDHNFPQNKDKFSNTIEAEFVANIIFAVMTFANWASTSDIISVGILTPYNNQRILILSKINEKIIPISDDIRKKISFEVNTIDGFQGQERDIIIMSCVRSDGIGFLSDRQRLCVALTRAKYSLILCGNFKTFLKDKMWKELLSDAKKRGVLCRIDDTTPYIIKQFIIK